MVCKFFTALVLLLVTLTTVAAAIGVWHTHVMPTGVWVFGTAEGSLSLLVLIVSLMAWLKLFKKMCSCGSKMGCGTGSCSCGMGGACMCGKDGMMKEGMGAKCPVCGKNPCKCK